jgi:hypothetical protein
MIKAGKTGRSPVSSDVNGEAGRCPVLPAGCKRAELVHHGIDDSGMRMMPVGSAGMTPRAPERAAIGGEDHAEQCE